MNVSARLLTIDEGDNVWVMQALEDGDFGCQVVFEFLVELREIHRLNGD